MFDAARLLRHTEILASDEFEGRAPGTKGEELAVAWIAEQMEEIGLAPGGDGGRYFQSVPLVGMRSTSTPLRVGAEIFRPHEDFVGWSRIAEPEVHLDAPLLFLGYGADAPEHAWNDFAGIDLANKAIVVLVGDPPPTDDEPDLFGGRALSYHGRWTCKLEQAAANGSRAALVVHETGAAGYPFSIVQGRPDEHFDLFGAARAAVEGWLTTSAAERLFAAAGHDFGALKKHAGTRGFKPVDLGVRAALTVRNDIRRVDSRNVVGVLRGTSRPDECVVVTAHWDHLGLGPPIDGDPVRHGARDNAVAVASLLELARAFAGAPPARSLVFVATTAEEQGQLGAEHHAQHPHVGLDRTLAVLNFEMPNVYGRTRDLIVYGLGQSDLDDYARDAARARSRTLSPDPLPEQGLFYRSDHFPFALRGVPALWAGGGVDYVGRPPDYHARVTEDWIHNRYHKPADRVTAEWDLSGAIDDVRVYYDIASALAKAERFPQWKPHAQFRRPVV